MSKTEMIVELQEEVKALRMKVGGYKTSNENYRNKIQELGDELVATKKRFCLEMQKNEYYDKKNSDQINQFYREKEVMRARISQLEKENEKLGKNLASVSEEFKEYKALPWYKRIFAK